MAQHRKVLDIGTGIDDLHVAAFAICDRKRLGQCRLDRAATAERTAPIVHPREQPLLESVCDVRTARKRLTVLRTGQQLERRLAVAVFEIIATQATTMDRQQHLPA